MTYGTQIAAEHSFDNGLYILDELCTPGAAQRIIAELKKSVLSLEHFPGHGKLLDALAPVHTEYRYPVCENCCIFHLYSEEDVIVVRILHQRQDCLKALLMDN